MTAAALSRKLPSEILRLRRGLRRRGDKSLATLKTAAFRLSLGRGDEIGFEIPYKRDAASILFEACMAEITRRCL